MLQRRAAAQQERLRARAVPQRAQSHAICLGMRKAAVMRAVSRRPEQEVELQVVVTPLLHRPAREIEEPLPCRRVGTIERVGATAPVLACVPNDRRTPIGAFQEPVRMRRGNARPFGDREGRKPQPGLEPPAVDLVGEPAVAVRELVVRHPVTRRPLVAVVQLDVAKEAAVEAAGAELRVGDDVRFGDAPPQLMPRAPAGGRRDGGQPLAVHR